MTIAMLLSCCTDLQLCPAGPCNLTLTLAHYTPIVQCSEHFERTLLILVDPFGTLLHSVALSRKSSDADAAHIELAGDLSHLMLPQPPQTECMATECHQRSSASLA